MGRKCIEFSRAGLELRDKETQAALYLLRVRLDAISAKVSRLEFAILKQRTFSRREIGEPAIIAALLVLAGLLGFSLVSRLL
jgi:hypothetical protein